METLFVFLNVQYCKSLTTYRQFTNAAWIIVLGLFKEKKKKERKKKRKELH